MYTLDLMHVWHVSAHIHTSMLIHQVVVRDEAQVLPLGYIMVDC